jgi:hypothetical protein
MCRILLLFAVLFLAAGCSAGRALEDMKLTKALYETCLAENPKNHGACAREKEVYEEAGRAYDKMSPEDKEPY